MHLGFTMSLSSSLLMARVTGLCIFLAGERILVKSLALARGLCTDLITEDTPLTLDDPLHAAVLGLPVPVIAKSALPTLS